MWARRGAPPAKQWPPGRLDPRSGREKMRAVEQGARGAQPQQALGACGDSTQKTPLGSSGPVPVLVMSLLFIASVFMLHIWGKYTRS
uniref:protein transport protein Sec61 subunit beta isoform X2 n=1 Tax=Odobenus rosmarus divergens TaxID=9708 RepID=UPI00063C6EF7|nr:PREDICTED: protein transport protein Sec61 subunit beta isoform X2 [Odobenus rosmarus divergens]